MRLNILSSIVVALLLTACENYYSKNGVLIDKIPATQIKKYLREKKLSHQESRIYGLEIYQLIYTTKDGNNYERNASAVVVVPSDFGTDEESLGYSVVIDNHSTILDNSHAPSSLLHQGKIVPSAILFSAINGFITILPDYIGFGVDQTHYHPYLLKNLSAQNTKDLLKAFKKWSKQQQINIDFKRALYMFGYSEGAYVSLASVAELEKSGVRFSYIVAGGGAYILDRLALEMVHSKNPEAILFIANTLYAYSKRYKDIQLTEIINPKYLSRFQEAFEEKKSKEEIVKLLPKSILGANGLFRENLEIANSPLLKHLKENSLQDVKIQNSLKLLHCQSDNLIPYEQAEFELQKLQENGAIVTLNNVERFTISKKMTHKECAIATYLIAAKIFRQIRLVLQGY